MTVEEWQARIVERTLCNDWTSEFDKTVWTQFFCVPCGGFPSISQQQTIWTFKTSNVNPRRYACACGAQRFLTYMDGYMVKFLPCCPQCKTFPDERIEVVDNIPQVEPYTRLSCQCRYLRARFR